MKTIEDFNFKDKQALIRVDFNVPLNDQHEVTDATRIEAAKPSITKVLEDGGSVVLMSHLGRPEGVQEEFSLKYIVNKVSEIIGVQVKFASDCVSDEAFKMSENLQNGEVLLLENLRFYAEEKKGDEDFAKKLAKHGDIYINDAFGTAHRAHASTTIVAQFFDEKCFGYLLAKEIKSLNKVLHSKEKPVTAILGGAKVSSKITVIENILPKVDNLIIGGGMAYTFIKAQGGKIGDSLVEDDKLDLALDIIESAKAKGVNLHLPIDSINADVFDNEANTTISKVNSIPDGFMGLDIGEETASQFAEIITMAYLGFFLKRLGFHKVISIGIAAYCIRYAIFGTESFPVWVMVISQAFHGFCYAFFFAAAYIYVDKIADEDVRHSAQTVFGIIILGGGPVIGGWLSGYLQNVYTINGIFDYSAFWYILSIIGLATTLFFYFLFQNQLKSNTI